MDTALQLEVVMCLRRAAQPIRPQQIATAVNARLGDVYDELGYLVRHGAARRHHCADAVVRYAAVGRHVVAGGTAATDTTPEITPHRMVPRERKSCPAPKASVVLDKMSNAPMGAREITAACTGLFSEHQVADHLQTLKRRGEVRKVSGSTSNAVWQRVAPISPAEGGPMKRNDTTLPLNLAAAQHLPIDTDEELPPWLGERMRDTFHDIFHAAADAATDKEP